MHHHGPANPEPAAVYPDGRPRNTHFPGKSNCLILDLVGATSRHKLVTAATLFNLDPHRLSEVGAVEALNERDSPGHEFRT